MIVASARGDDMSIVNSHRISEYYNVYTIASSMETRHLSRLRHLETNWGVGTIDYW